MTGTEVTIRIQDPNSDDSWRRMIQALVLERLKLLSEDGNNLPQDHANLGNLLAGIPFLSDF